MKCGRGSRRSTTWRPLLTDVSRIGLVQRCVCFETIVEWLFESVPTPAQVADVDAAPPERQFRKAIEADIGADP